MHPIRLKTSVTIQGPNLWGLNGKITFHPSGSRDGWIWWVRNSFNTSISPAIIDKKARRTRLYCQGKKLQIFEHIGALRFFGLCRVYIESTTWPPYHGRSIELWQAIRKHCKEDTSEEINWYALRKPVRWTYPKPRNSKIAFTEIRPSTKKQLRLKIMCSYPGLQSCQLEFSFPNRDVLEELCRVHSPGWPPILYHLLKVPSLFGWPHYKKIFWPQDYSKTEASIKLVHHRALDLLGALSLLCRDGLLSADVTSICSGHEADINTIIEADKYLYRL